MRTHNIQMFNELVEMNEDLSVSNRLWSAATGHDYHLSIEGAALFNACIGEIVLKYVIEAVYYFYNNAWQFVPVGAGLVSLAAARWR